MALSTATAFTSCRDSPATQNTKFWKDGTVKRAVAMVDVSDMVSVPKGKAAGSVVARAAEDKARPLPPLATPRAIGFLMPIRSSEAVAKFAPSTPMMQQCTVVSAVEAPIIPACTTASAAVARGIKAKPSVRVTPKIREMPAIVRMPVAWGVFL